MLMGLGFLEGFGVLALLSSGVYVWIFNLISLKFLVFNILWLFETNETKLYSTFRKSARPPRPKKKSGGTLLGAFGGTTRPKDG